MRPRNFSNPHSTVEPLAILTQFYTRKSIDVHDVAIAFFCLENILNFNSPPNPDRAELKDTFVWKLRACRDVRLFQFHLLNDNCDFPLHRHEGWVGRIDRSTGDGFPFSEWTCASFLTVRHEKDCTTYKLFNWRDDDNWRDDVIWRDDIPLEHCYKLEEYGIKDCGKDGRAYTDFLANIVRYFLVWYAIWTKTLDAVDKLVGIQV